MKELKELACKKHVLVCVNQRDAGKECCASVGGEEIFQALKSFVAANNFTGTVWVTRVRCLGFCNAIGTTVVIYPDRRWFTNVTMKDMNTLFSLLLAQGNESGMTL